MKTKSHQLSKVLIALAGIFCCIIFSLNSFGQNPGPDKADFYGTWLGTDQDGNTIEIILNSNSSCTFLINGIPDHASNPVKAFRLPQYLTASNTQSSNSNNSAANTNVPPDVASATSSPSGGPVNSVFTGPERTIKFYTQNGLRGIPATVPNTNQSNPDPNSISATITEQQIYTGLAVITVNGMGQLEMALYINMNTFSSTAPAVDFSNNPAGNIPAYATLTRQ